MTPSLRRRSVHAAIACIALLSATEALPQIAPPGPRGVVADPCPQPLQPPAELAAAMRQPDQPPPPAVQAFLKETARRAQTDWPDLCRYAADDVTIRGSGHTPAKAVFIGDSITEGWTRLDPSFFDANHIVGRGISGQVSAQTLLRFQQDVISLHPQLVQIMVGTNDIAGNAGPTTYAAIERNLTAMVRLARFNGIRVVLATIPPASDFPWHKGTKPAEKIGTLNAWVKTFAKRENLVVADYHRLLDDGNGGFRRELSLDGVHPNLAGYRAMDRIAQAALSAATMSRN